VAVPNSTPDDAPVASAATVKSVEKGWHPGVVITFYRDRERTERIAEIVLDADYAAQIGLGMIEAGRHAKR